MLRRDGFTFKQFFVAHDRCAMKVGTDGVLLGSWVSLQQAHRVLDIGCGSGLVALMMAQRSASHIKIEGVELDCAAAGQACDNVAASPWAARITIHADDIQRFTEGHCNKYDLIVSNPPYFPPAVACRDGARDRARYIGSLTHNTLLRCAEKLLSAEGRFCVILPHQIGQRFMVLASQQGWFLHQQVDICDRPGKPLHRMLLAISRKASAADYQCFAIHQSDREYSADFRQLISDFYLFY